MNAIPLLIYFANWGMDKAVQMGDVVNLNKFRKAKAKGDKTQKAEENRTKFGRTKGEKARDKSSTDKAGREHDGHELEDDDPDDGLIFTDEELAQDRGPDDPEPV